MMNTSELRYKWTRAARYAASFRFGRGFVRAALPVMLPVVAQQLVSALFSLADTLMVGSLDELSMTAVAVANKPFLIFSGLFFGVTGGAGILLSQYLGARDTEQLNGIFAVEMLLAILSSLAVGALLWIFPEQVMRVFVADSQTVGLGVLYLRVVCLSYLPVAVSSVCMFSLRALGHNQMPMRVSLIAVSLNVALNYVLIFGKFGLPRLGVVGAAWGTLLARLIEVAIYLAALARGRAFFSLNLKNAARVRRGVLRNLWRRIAPLTLNELLYWVGINTFFWVYARLDEAALPALTIAETAANIGAVLYMGIFSAVAVMVGKLLGADDFRGARENAKKLFALVLVISLLAACVGFLCALVIPRLFHIDEGLKALATRMTVALALFFPLQAAYGFSFFLLRAGGDTRGALILDSVYMWLLPIPISLSLPFLPWPVSIFTALVLVQLLLGTRLILSYRYVRRGRWLRNVTADE